MAEDSQQRAGARILLTLPLFVEPDRQRMAGFVLDATAALGGNAFSASLQIAHLMGPLRAACKAADRTVEVCLVLEGTHLILEWGDQRSVLLHLKETPTTFDLDHLAERLRLASETSNSELLRMRNRQINEELGRFMATAAEQMAEMEAVLERRKAELEDSIRQAETDALTGIFNRGAYDTRLREAWLHCQRQREDMCLLLCDLDHFKSVNDTYGHQYGDDYLKKMAAAMRAAVREHVDLPCRMGGDEFAIIAFCDMGGAIRIAERILAAMADMVSIGIARLRGDDTVQTLVARADAALYEAKANGRGRYVVESAAPTLAVVAAG